ncbi:MAG TPA: hypothetical protein VK250_05140 [Nitrososphaeraceae archaeon]|nr:hypothetical protein [Nitrososphaeraceae archaeon]
MKTLLFFIIIFCININIKAQDIKTVIIKYVDFEIETPARVSCDRFDTVFGSINNVNVPKNKINNFVKKFNCYIKNLSEADLNLDTRGKIEFYYENYRKIYCFNDYLISINDKIYFMPKDIMVMINQIISNDSIK